MLVPMLAAPSNGQAAVITEFPGGIASPEAIVGGPQNSLWFTQNDPPRIGRITTSGAITNFSMGLSPDAVLGGITVGPDGNLWFTEEEPSRIGMLNPGNGQITEFKPDDFFTEGSVPEDITTGPDGNLWFTENAIDSIGRLKPGNKQIDEFDLGDEPNGGPRSIVTGPDGNLWFTQEASPGAIGRLSTSGDVSQFAIPTAGGGPEDITVGPDGNLWFTENRGAGRIGRITPAGVITEFSVGLTAASGPDGIAAGADGNLWFTQSNLPGGIGRITPAGVITQFNSGLTPGSEPRRIASGPDGNLWFTERTANAIGRVLIQVPPVATTGDVRDTSASGTTADGSVNASGLPTTYSFEYGPTTAYGASSPATPAGNAETPVAATARLTGLEPSVTYHYRVVARNSAGTSTGEDRTFVSAGDSTPPPPPVPPPPPIVPAPPTGSAPVVRSRRGAPVGATFVVLNSSVDAGGLATTARGACRSSRGGKRLLSRPAPVLAGVHGGRLRLRISGLRPFSSYKCRTFASNAAGSAEGQLERLRTDERPLRISLPRRTTGRAGIPTRVRFRSSVLALVSAEVRLRGRRAPGRSSRIWRRQARPGANRIVLRPLAPGHYRLVLHARSRDGQRAVRTASLRVRPRPLIRSPLFTG